MPLGRAVPFVVTALLALAVASCTATPLPALEAASAQDRSPAGLPQEIRFGSADMVIQAVDASVAREEVASAVQTLIANAPVCTRWPAIWMEQTSRRGLIVRYDLMARDWGEDAVATAQARMDEFVELGFLIAQPAGDTGIVEYRLTEAGERYLDGIIEPGRRPRFCAPAERTLVEITGMEWGRFPCGTLQVQFTHVANEWPSWARAEATRARLAQNWPAPGVSGQGAVSLSRVWYSRRQLPDGVSNGGLTSACYDASRQQIVGDDLTLNAGDFD